MGHRNSTLSKLSEIIKAQNGNHQSPKTHNNGNFNSNCIYFAVVSYVVYAFYKKVRRFHPVNFGSYYYITICFINWGMAYEKVGRRIIFNYVFRPNFAFFVA